MNQTVTTVLFDFDGTVFDTVEGLTKSIQYALRLYWLCILFLHFLQRQFNYEHSLRREFYI